MKQKIKQIWYRMTADKRQFSLFCTLLCIAILLWARIIVIARPPRTAIADKVASIALNQPQSFNNQPIPVLLDKVPSHNPFLVSATVFPSIVIQETDKKAFKELSVEQVSRSHSSESFHLEAVMGQIARINGRIYRIGDILLNPDSSTSFTIVDIAGRSVIISTKDRRYVLSITP